MSKTLYIIDGHAHIYAAYYAPMRPLTSPSGEPTKATYVFTTMLLGLLSREQPDMVVVALDSKAPTFRHEMYPEYKANRPPMPDDLPVQIGRIEEILRAMNVATLRIDGFEADDIMGTLARRAAADGIEVKICTKDKDILQLLGDQVCMFDIAFLKNWFCEYELTSSSKEDTILNIDSTIFYNVISLGLENSTLDINYDLKDPDKLSIKIFSEEKGFFDNVGNRIAATDIAQGFQGAYGGETQSIRNQIKTLKPAIILSIKDANPSIGAKGMDTPKELEFYLSAVGDEKRDIQSNMAALAILEESMGLKSSVKLTPKIKDEMQKLKSSDDVKRAQLQDLQTYLNKNDPKPITAGDWEEVD